jgi:diaminopimelate decarboxylase
MINENIVARAVSTYDSPLFLYSKSTITSTAKSLMRALPDDALLLYSVKANPNPTIIRLLSQAGLFFEVASEGELRHILNIGIKPDSVIFSGQGKSVDGIQLAVERSVKVINVESVRELSDINSCCEKLNKMQPVMLRVNPKIDNHNSVLKMGGVPSPYGIDEEQIENVIRKFVSNNVRITGLFMYVGSQYFDECSILNNTAYLLDLANSINKNLHIPICSLDFGGGFGVPEDASEKELDLLKLSEGMCTLFTEERLNCLGGRCDFFFESGRFLVARSAIYIARVIDVKISRSVKYAVLDGGINNLGIKQLQYRTYEPKVSVLGKERVENERVTIVGPTCTPIDIVCQDVLLPKVNIGDYIVIEDCGAYSMYFSPVHFCGHDSPAEVLYDETEGRFMQIKLRGDKSHACGYGFVD